MSLNNLSLVNLLALLRSKVLFRGDPPTPHRHPASDIIGLAVDGSAVPQAHASTHNAGGSDPMAIDAAAGVGSLRTLGTSGTSACAGNDSRLSNARTPTSHASSHNAAGSDPITLGVADLAPVVSGVVLGSDQFTTSASFGDVSGMSFSLASGATYIFEFEGGTTAALSTTRPILAVNGPSASAIRVNGVQPNNAGALGAAWNTTTSYDNGATPAASGGATAWSFRVSGVVTTTAAGTLTLRLATSTVGSTVTVKAGSWGRLTRIA